MNTLDAQTPGTADFHVVTDACTQARTWIFDVRRRCGRRGALAMLAMRELVRPFVDDISELSIPNCVLDDRRRPLLPLLLAEVYVEMYTSPS